MHSHKNKGMNNSPTFSLSEVTRDEACLHAAEQRLLSHPPLPACPSLLLVDCLEEDLKRANTGEGGHHPPHVASLACPSLASRAACLGSALFFLPSECGSTGDRSLYESIPRYGYILRTAKCLTPLLVPITTVRVDYSSPMWTRQKL